jgi:hypothetical protein
MSEEPEIIINGINVGPGCALTIRVAIETFAGVLIENGLGDDEHGKIMKKNYLERINDIRKAMRVKE